MGALQSGSLAQINILIGCRSRWGWLLWVDFGYYLLKCKSGVIRALANLLPTGWTFNTPDFLLRI
jgi:hypothetical protein